MAKKLKKLTATKFENWTPAKVALGHIEKSSLGFAASVRVLWPRLNAGLIRAAAENVAFSRSKAPPYGVTAIEPELWRQIGNLDENYDFWRSGTLLVSVEREGYGYDNVEIVTYFGVRFDPEGLKRTYSAANMPLPEEVVPPKAAPGPNEPRNLGGRQKAWWREPLLIELSGQLHDLTLEPRILADLEKAAHDWLGKQGEYPGERTVRNVVTPLWERISKGGKNPTR